MLLCPRSLTFGAQDVSELLASPSDSVCTTVDKPASEEMYLKGNDTHTAWVCSQLHFNWQKNSTFHVDF